MNEYIRRLSRTAGDAHFIDKIEEKKSWIQVPVVTIIIAVHVIVFFYVVMYALFVLSVHVYYVNCNAKTPTSQFHRKYYFGQEEEEMKLCLMILSVPWYMLNGLEHIAILSHFS
jgi:hypothetical protein